LEESLAADRTPAPLIAANTAELELLKRRLAEYEDRQKEFDDLRRRIDEFERQDRNDVRNVEKRFKDESDFAIDDNIIEDHKDWVRKVFGRQSELNLVSMS
jgi:hypothetical protein